MLSSQVSTTYLLLLIPGGGNGPRRLAEWPLTVIPPIGQNIVNWGIAAGLLAASASRVANGREWWKAVLQIEN